MADRPKGKVVVGFDGSSHSWTALNWALQEAKLRRVGVVIIHCFDHGMALADTNWSAQWMDRVAEDAKSVLDRALQRARHEGIEVEGRLEFGAAAQALVRASQDAEMLVVGSRGRGGLAGAVLGSVSAACVHRAVCPVVVVTSS